MQRIVFQKYKQTIKMYCCSVAKSCLTVCNPWTATVNVFSSVQFSHSVVSDSLQPHGLQHTRPPCPSPAPRVYSNSCPLSRRCHPAISSSVVPLSSHLQSFPASGLFQGVSSSHQVAKVAMMIIFAMINKDAMILVF